MRCLAFSVMAVSLLGGVAAADANYTMAVGMAGGKLTCQLAKNGQASPTASLVVRFTPKAKLKISAVKADTNAAVTLAPDKDDQVATIDVAAMKETDSLKLTVTTDKGSAVCEAVKARAAGGGDGGKGGDRKDEPSPATPDDSAASRWWLGEGGARALDALTRIGRQRGLPDDTRFVVYLPSGHPVFPAPSSVREGTPVQIVMIQPSQGAPDVQVVTKNCAAVKAFRVTGDSGTEKQGAPGGVGAAPPRFELSARGPYLRCGAGSLTYDLQIKAGSAAAVTVSQTLEVRPVYSFALLTTLGFDTTISHDFQAVPAAGGGDIVTPRHDRIGPSILVGGQWMLGGVDYTDLRWYNYFGNPFLAFEAASPLTGFVVGDTLTIRGGISLAIGLAAHKGTRLRGVRVGDPLPTGDVPKDATWHAQRLGLYLGVALDSKVFEALKAH